MSLTKLSTELVKHDYSINNTVERSAKDKFGDYINLMDFGAVGDGIADDTVSVTNAFTFAQNNGLRLLGSPGRTHKITAKIPITKGNFQFDGQNCIFTNAISDSTAADPLLELSGDISNIHLGNFRVNGTSNNGHIISILGGLATGPQFIILERLWVQYSSGNGKDKDGNPMSAKLVYSYGGMALKIDKCTSYMSGGIYLDNVLKVSISGTTIDSPPAGRLLYLNACNGVCIDQNCIFNGGITDQVEVNSCKGVLIIGNRLKGGSGRQLYAHGASSNVSFHSNQQEVYNLTSNAVEFTTAVSGVKATENSIAFINSSNQAIIFTNSGLAIVDEPGGGYISSGADLSGNSFIINSLITVTNLISAESSLNSVRCLKVSNNSLAAPGGGSSSTVTNGINLKSNVFGAEVSSNQYGATIGNTMINGIVIGTGCNGTRLIENFNFGNCTNTIVDSASYTTRKELGILVSNTFTPAVSGTTVVGTGTYTTQSGTYTQDGKFSNVWMNISWTAHTGTGSMTVNLPFTVANKLQVLNVMADGLTYTGQLCAAVSAGDNKIRIWSETSGNTLAQLAFDTAATLYINGVLEIA